MSALAAGSSAAMGTGAFTAAEVSGRDVNINVVDDTNGLIGLEAGESPLVTNTGGAGENELAIDFDPNGNSGGQLQSASSGGHGVNPNSTYQVGGFGRFDLNNQQYLPGDPTAMPNVEQVAMYITSESFAFKAANQATEAKSVEITYDPNETFPDGVRLYLVGIYENADESPPGTGESGLVVGDATDTSAKSASILLTDDEDDPYTEQLDAGDDVKVTLLIDVDGIDEEDYTNGEVDIGGEIIIRAGSHDELTDIQ
jgi:hypothetical protein